MPFVTLDGDDIGRKLAACYLSNNVNALKETRALVELKTKQISRLLSDLGYDVIFCAADGVTGFNSTSLIDDKSLYQKIIDVVGDELAFSAGVGDSLSEAYVALLYAKSSGKARICNFRSIGENV